MKPRDLVFAAIVIVVVGGLYFLSQRSGRIPQLPSNPEHQEAKSREQCLKCHTADKMGALEAARKHPLKWRDPKVSCHQCHQNASPQKALNQIPLNQSPDIDVSWLKQH